MQEAQSDEALMLEYQLGDEKAFQVLYTRHSGRVLAYLRSRLQDEAKVRDTFQATFLKLHRTRSRYNPNLAFAPWLFIICRSELLDLLKKDRSLKEEMPLVFPEPPSAMEVETGELDLSVLDEKQKQVLSLRYQQESSFEDIALALRTTPVHARQMVSRALKKLRNVYAKR